LANRNKYRIWEKRREKALKHNLPATLTPDQAELLLMIGRATYPGEELHLDHMVPVSKGGGTTMANTHYIPARLNYSKYDKLPQGAYRQLGLGGKNVAQI